MQVCDGFAVLVRQANIIVALAMGPPEPNDRFGLQPILFDDLFQHGAGIRVQLPRLFAHHRVLENGRELAVQVPGDKKGCPVDGGNEVRQGIVVQGCDAGLPGYGRLVMGPVEEGCCLRGAAVGQPIAALLALADPLPDRGVVGGHLFFETVFAVAHQGGGNADAARRIGDIDHGVVVVSGGNFYRGMGLGGCGATNHQRYLEVLSLHFGGNVGHFFQ